MAVATAVHHRAGRAVRAVGAATAAALLTLCMLLAQWHQATVAHVRCAHGELVHVAAASASGHHETVDRLAVSSRSDAGHEEHEHCSIYPRVHDGAARVAAPVAAVMPEVGAAPVPTLTATIQVVTDRLDVAPKTSPPAVRSSRV